MKSERMLVYKSTDLQAEKLDSVLNELGKGSFKIVRFINCNLGDVEAKRIANTINSNKNLRKLRHLDLRYNHILVAGQDYLVKASKGCPRLKIDCRFNYIDQGKTSVLVFAEKVNADIEKMSTPREAQPLPPANDMQVKIEEVAAIAHEASVLPVECDDTFSVLEPCTPKEEEKFRAEECLDDWIVVNKSQFSQNTLFSPKIDLGELVIEDQLDETDRRTVGLVG